MGTGGSYAVASPNDLWQYRSVVYYIDDGSLCRQRLTHSLMSKSPAECLVDGIADAELLWGIDAGSGSTSAGDGQADLYTTTPTSAQMRGAVSVRICLLLESEGELRSYTNDNTYAMGNENYTPADTAGRGYRRKLYTSTVQLRNNR